MCSWSKIIKTTNNKIKIFWLFFGILIFFIIDRLSKILSIKFLSTDGVFLFSDKVGLILENNQGISYSIPFSGIYLIIAIIAIIAGLVYLGIRAYARQEINVVISVALIIAGAVSNLFDRIQYGYVIDMLVLIKWPVFNIADIMILVGGIWLIIIYLKKK